MYKRQALTNAGAESANYPFCTIEPNVGVVSVPDERLDKLDVYKRQEIVGGNYKIKFDSQGYATSITTLNGGSVSDSVGNNWINVSEIWVYWRGLYEQNDPKNYRL